MRIPGSLYARARVAAAADERSVAYLVRQAVLAELERLEAAARR